MEFAGRYSANAGTSALVGPLGQTNALSRAAT
jgi:hypothetical protein